MICFLGLLMLINNSYDCSFLILPLWLPQEKNNHVISIVSVVDKYLFYHIYQAGSIHLPLSPHIRVSTHKLRRRW
jgi:hypothetical protein